MTHKTTFILGATIGVFLGVFGVLLWHFYRPVDPPVFVRMVEV